jgi:chaperonin GroEL
VTLGPKGRNVVIERASAPPHHQGRRFGRQGNRTEGQVREPGRPDAARSGLKSNDKAGDGTTTATVLAQAIVREGLVGCRRHEPDGPEARHRSAAAAVVET